ncbi:MAG: methylated-DNA--[protein]-cysteine S-methyltransferase, partial [Pseudomonadota bacterium]
VRPTARAHTAPMDTEAVTHRDYDRIADAIAWIAAHRRERPDVADMAGAAGLSSSQFSRLFRRWAGISPQRYLAHLTLADARDALRRDATVEAAAWETGLSGPGRLHDLFVAIDAVTPGEFRRGGEGLTLQWAFGPTPFGDALLVRSLRGIVALRLGDAAQREQRLADLRGEWPGAVFEPMSDGAAAVATVFEPSQSRIDVLLVGTPFQHKVWQALVALEPGETVSYATLAERIGQPGSARAVGGAVGANSVAILIPCHRVLRADGGLGGYRWGPERKRVVLAWEQCRGLAAEESGVLSSATP